MRHRETAELAKALIEQAVGQQPITPSILHADRGAPMRSKHVSELRRPGGSAGPACRLEHVNQREGHVRQPGRRAPRRFHPPGRAGYDLPVMAHGNDPSLPHEVAACTTLEVVYEGCTAALAWVYAPTISSA